MNMNVKMKHMMRLALAGMLVSSAAAYAADGNPGNSSNTSAQVTAQIPGIVRITGFGDGTDLLDLGLYDFATPGNMDATDTFCVWRNRGGVTAGNYQIVFQGDSGDDSGTAFQVINADLVRLDYEVYFDDASIPTPPTGAVTSTTPVTAQVASQSPTCATGNLAGLVVRIPQATADAASEGTYTGDLLVTVTVE